MNTFHSSRRYPQLVTPIFYAGVWISLSGFLALLGWLFDISIFSSFSIDVYAPRIPFVMSIAFLFLGVAIITILSPYFEKKESIGLNITRALALAIPAGIGLNALIQYLNASSINLFLMFTVSYPQLSVPAIASLSITLIALALFIFWRNKKSEKAVVYGVGVITMFVFQLTLYASMGFLFKIPVLFSFKMAFPGILNFLVACVTILWGTIPFQGLYQPICSPVLGTRWAAISAIGIDLLILLIFLVGIISIDTIMLTSTSLNLQSLYFGMELVGLTLSLLITTLILRTVHYFERTLILSKAEAEAMRHLRESEEKFRTLANNIPNIAWTAAPDGKALWYNQRAYDYTGMTLEQLSGWGWQSAILSEQLPEILSKWKEFIGSNEPESIIIQIRGVDGVYRPFLTSVVPIKNDTGEIIQWFGSCTDVSFEVQAKDEAISASKRKSQFLSTMSHEFRTPLNAIIGFSEMMQKGMAGELNEKQKKYASHIATGGKHLLEMVNEILDLSKIEADKLDLYLEKVDIYLLVGELKSLFQEMAQQNQIQLDFLVDSGLPSIESDPVRLKQILLNLLSNAIKFNRIGGKVIVRLFQESNELVCQITDTGIGMSQETMSELFREFYQADNTFARKYEGAGLGLSITKKLIELHGGTITVASEPDKGSTFTFRLPFQQAPKVSLVH